MIDTIETIVGHAISGDWLGPTVSILTNQSKSDKCSVTAT